MEPWGPERADLRAGIIASTIANCAIRQDRFKPIDFMPRFGEREEPEQDGLAPAKVMAVMDRLRAHQERVLKNVAG